jgi:hypothetical protein
MKKSNEPLYTSSIQKGSIGHCTMAQVFNSKTGLSVCTFNSTEDPAISSELAKVAAKALNDHFDESEVLIVRSKANPKTEYFIFRENDTEIRINIVNSDIKATSKLTEKEISAIDKIHFSENKRY